ncbi:MAG: sensor histidine kinase [Chitinophagales bacterium]
MNCIIILTYLTVAILLKYIGSPFDEGGLPTGVFAYFTFATLMTITLTRKVLNENYKYNQITIEQNKVLETQNEELERFTYIASHDLKSPVSNIMGFSDIIQGELEEGNYELAQQYMAYIQISSKRMSYLIEDILELSKVRNGKKENRQEVSFNDIVKTVKQALLQDIEKKNAQIICQDLPLYSCNETEFSLVFQNLIQNGIKYNKSAKPTIEIWSSESKNSLFLYFKDNGIGIEEKYYTQIFEYFKRLHTQTEYEGTGIGLGLCKRIAENYNGSISVKSNLNQGSVFTLELPLQKHPKPPLSAVLL